MTLYYFCKSMNDIVMLVYSFMSSQDYSHPLFQVQIIIFFDLDFSYIILPINYI